MPARIGSHHILLELGFCASPTQAMCVTSCPDFPRRRGQGCPAPSSIPHGKNVPGLPGLQACSVHSWEGRLSHVRRPALKTKCLGFKTGSMTQGNPLPVSATAFHLQSRGEKNACLQDCLEDQGMCSKSTRVLAPVDFSNSNFKNRYLFIKVWMMYNQGFPGGSDSKESACNVRDQGLIAGSGRFLGEGNGYPLHYSWLENSMDRKA